MTILDKIRATGRVQCITPGCVQQPNPDNGYIKKDLSFTQPERVSDRRLKSMYVCDLADTFGVEMCRECESQCAYGREYIRRTEMRKYQERKRET